MARRGGFGHLGAGGHEGVVEELAVIARVADHVDDAHGFFFLFLFFWDLLLSLSCFVVTNWDFVRFGWRNVKIWISGSFAGYLEFDDDPWWLKLCLAVGYGLGVDDGLLLVTLLASVWYI